MEIFVLMNIYCSVAFFQNDFHDSKEKKIRNSNIYNNISDCQPVLFCISKKTIRENFEVELSSNSC